MLVTPPNLYVKILISNVILLGSGAFERQSDDETRGPMNKINEYIQFIINKIISVTINEVYNKEL